MMMYICKISSKKYLKGHLHTQILKTLDHCLFASFHRS